MGKLAPFGIVGGRKVPVSGVLEHSGADLQCGFTKRVLESAGYIDVAEKLFAGEPLGVSEIVRLSHEAPVPVLLKLVEFKRNRRLYRGASPVVLLPLMRWRETLGMDEALRRSIWYLEQIDYDDFRVVIDRIDMGHFDNSFADGLLHLSGSRQGMVLVGPSTDEILSWILGGDDGRLTALDTIRFVRTLGQLKQAGLGGLRPSSLASMMKVVYETGLSTSLVTPVDIFESPREFAETLLRINELSGKSQVIRVWSPALTSRTENRIHHAARDVVLLRAIALGAICLENIPFIRGSSRFLSQEAIRMAPLFGANDAGVGAVNSETAKELSLLPYSVITESFSQAVKADEAQVSPLVHPL